MATTIQVDGLATIKVDTGGSHALETLGYTINGVEITEDVRVLDVFTDENGGDAGPPTDVQQMGELHVVTMHLSKWDEAVVDKIRPRLYGGTAGTVGAAGSLLQGGSLFYRLLIHSVSRPRNYLVATFRDAFEINKGTKHSQYRIVATCYHNASRVLYNSTTS